MSVVYDAGMLIALERNDRRAWLKHNLRLRLKDRPITTAPVVAQVSRSARQASLHRALTGCLVIGFESSDAAPTGELLASTGTHDVVDAHLVLVAARDSSTILTSDARDLTRLSDHVGNVSIESVIA